MAPGDHCCVMAMDGDPAQATIQTSSTAADTPTSTSGHPAAAGPTDLDGQRDIDGLTFWLQLLHGQDTDELLIVTYGITNTHRGRRDFTTNTNPTVIRSQALETWSDTIDPADCRVDVVNPQPRLLLLRKYLVLLVSSVRGCPMGNKPILADTRTPRDAAWPSSGLTAQHVRHPGTYAGHLLDLPYGRLCTPHGLRECELMIGGSYVRNNDLGHFPTGALFRLNIHDLPEMVQRHGRYFPNFEEFALEVLDRMNNGYGMPNGQIYLRIFGPTSGTNTFVDLHFIPGQLLSPQTLWSMIRRTWTGLRDDIEVNLLQPQLAVWSDGYHRQPIHLTLSNYAQRDHVPVVVQIVDQNGIFLDFRFVMLRRGLTTDGLTEVLTSQDWWPETDQAIHLTTFGTLAASTITSGRFLRVVVPRQEGDRESDFQGLLQTDLHASQARLIEDSTTYDTCLGQYRDDLPGPQTEVVPFIFNGMTTWLTGLIETLHHTDLIENDDEGRVIYIRSWFINHLDDIPYASRVVRLREIDDIWWWQQDIAEAWHDVLPRLTNVEFTLVQPRPPRQSQDEVTTEHVIVTVNRADAPLATQNAGISSRSSTTGVTQQRLIVIPPVTSSREIYRRSQVITDENYDAVDFLLDGLPLSDEHLRTRYGASWIITETPTPDTASLMQRHRPSSAPKPSPSPMHFFKRQQAYAVLWLRDENPTDALTEHWELPQDGDDSISDLHLIHDPPDFIHLDSGVAYIAETPRDRRFKLNEDDVLVLFHLRFLHERHNEPTTRFRTIWVPNKASHHRMLVHLRSAEYCEHPGVTCRLFFNNILWPNQDQAIRHFRAGDYLRLTIDSSSRHFCELVDVEIADRERRLFTNATSSESEERPADSPTSERQDERSRSRSRGHQDDADGVALLQTSVSRHRTALSDITNLQQDPKADTLSQSHVLDLWCTDLNVEGRQDPMILELDQLLTSQGRITAIHLWLIQDGTVNSLFIEVEGPPTSDGVRRELSTWGLTHEVTKIDVKYNAAEYLARPAGTGPTCLYFNPEESQVPIATSLAPSMEDIVHMRRLCELGFCRAVIRDTTVMKEDIQLIHFLDSATATFQNENSRTTPALPPRMPARGHNPIRHLLSPSNDRKSSHQVVLPFPVDELQELLGSADGILRTEVSFLPLPEDYIRDLEAATRTTDTLNIDSYDRLLIFVDGSSDPAHRHHDIEFIDQFGKSDAWAYAVVGERYGDNDESNLTLVGWTSQAVCYEKDSPWFTGVDRAGADVAERDALIWAGLWRLSINSDIPTVFCFDSATAGYFASGLFGSPQPSSQHRLLRGIFQAIEALVGQEHLGMHHVHGHCGLLWNELFDAAARYNASTVCFSPRQGLNIQKWRTVLYHLWMIFGGPSTPALQDGGFDVSPPKLPDATRDLPQCFPAGQSTTSNTQGEMRVSFATANVRTLSTGPTGYKGKIDFLQAQFDTLGLTIIGLQETRTDERYIKTRRLPYLRFCSGHDRGHHGVELWLSTTQPLGYIGKDPVYIQPHNVTVIYKDPRRLIARIESALEPLCVAVLHGPQSGIDECTRETWWTETVQLCQSCESGRLILLCDANASSGPQDDVTVFRYDDDTTPNTAFFNDALHQLDLCLPSTDVRHQGPHETWISPDGRTARRIDFVCVPQILHRGTECSTVLHDVDLGNGEGDHSAVGVQLHWICTTSTTPTTKQKLKFDDTKIRTMSHTDVKSYLNSSAHWHKDIETQVDTFNQQAHDLLSTHCACTVPRAKKPFFTPILWELRQNKLKYRRTVKNIHRVHRHELISAVFQSWRHAKAKHCHIDFDAGWNYRCSLLAYQLRATAGLHHYNSRLRKEIANGKDHFVQQHVNALGPNASASEILHRLRPIMGSSNQRKRKGASLPCVLDVHGQPCQTAQALQDRWIDFFGNMEGGERLDAQTQRDKWIQGLQCESTQEIQLPLSELPTLFDLECAFRHVRLGKATGHDQIPGELCHRFPEACATATYTHLLHLFLHGQEALVHKGGKLVTAYKKGHRDTCSSYRSLLISSHVGKSLHRTLRQTQNHLYAAFMQDQQLGGRQK